MAPSPTVNMDYSWPNASWIQMEQRRFGRMEKYSQASWEGPRVPVIQLQEFLSTLFLLYLIGKGPGDFWLWKPGAQIGSHRHLARSLWLTPAFSGLVFFTPLYILWGHYSFSLWIQGVRPLVQDSAPGAVLFLDVVGATLSNRRM